MFLFSANAISLSAHFPEIEYVQWDKLADRAQVTGYNAVGPSPQGQLQIAHATFSQACQGIIKLNATKENQSVGLSCFAQGVELATTKCDSSSIDCPSIDGQQPGYILLCVLSTRDELDKALAELIVRHE